MSVRKVPKLSSEAKNAFDKYGVVYENSDGAVQEAEYLLANPPSTADLIGNSNRRDLRHVPFVTLDSNGTKLRDDAFYLERDTSKDNQGGYKLWVAFPDVSHFIRSGSALDIQARKSFSDLTYDNGQTAHLFPVELKKHLFSLNPHADRACIGYEITLNPEAQVISYEFFTGLINCKAAFDHDDFNQGKLHNYMSKNLIKTFSQAVKRDAKKRFVVNSYAEKNISIDIVNKIMDISAHVAGLHLRFTEYGLFKVQSAKEAIPEKLNRIFEQAGLHLSDGEGDEGMIKGFIQQAMRFGDKGMVDMLSTNPKFSAEAGKFFMQGYEHFSSISCPMRRYPDVLTARLIKRHEGIEVGAATDEDVQNWPGFVQRLNEQANSHSTLQKKLRRG